jgi:hypothetical protein
MDALRKQLDDCLKGHGAHLDFDSAVKDFPPELRGRKTDGPHTAWQLLEHLRISQHDILDFCINPHYKEIKWPDSYWPPTPEPPDESAWDKSVSSFQKDLEAMRKLVADPKQDLFARILHGEGQTLLREALLVIDHNSYHLGQLVFLRKALEGTE